MAPDPPTCIGNMHRRFGKPLQLDLLGAASVIMSQKARILVLESMDATSTRRASGVGLRSRLTHLSILDGLSTTLVLVSLIIDTAQEKTKSSGVKRFANKKRPSSGKIPGL